MKSLPSQSGLLLCILLSSVLVGCDDDNENIAKPLEATLVENLPADPTQNPDGSTRIRSNKFTLFSFKHNTIISNSDSATTKWDIGFRSTTIIVNSGISGPGQVQAQVINGIFDELSEAPEAGYTSDAQGALAIPGNGWYNYTGQNGNPVNAIIPVPGKIFVLRTADNRFVKAEIISYYFGNPNTTTAAFGNANTRPPSRYFTFRFIYQPDGSRNF
jgi:hypothetical protein